MKKSIIILFAIVSTCSVWADGLLIPQGDTYLGEFLKNKSTSIEVKITGQVAETIVYQEFENESDTTVDVVYSFPLSMNARTTRLMYSKGDTLIDAKLKVKAQVQNPGTGEGGVVAAINEYMGSNALRFKLKSVGAHSITTFRLHYISNLSFVGGKMVYRYPLDLSDFVTQPLDYVKMKVSVDSNQDIVDYDMPNTPDYYIQKHETNALNLLYFSQKMYAARDLTFEYQVENNSMQVDLFSWKPDTTDGYFTMMGYPNVTKTEDKLPHRIMFMLCNSTTMAGVKLDQSKLAIKKCLDQLSATDFFNIMVYNSVNKKWSNEFLPATEENISAAKNYIDAVSSTYGNMLSRALESALTLVTSDQVLTSFLVFTDGKGNVDPYEIEESNTYKTGIFLVSIGNDYDRSRLETLAALNYGFVSYITDEDNLTAEMVNLFSKINHPIYKDINVEFLNPLVHDLYPAKFPAIFSNNNFLVTGRYGLPGDATINVSGLDYVGPQVFPFNVNFSLNTSDNYEFCRNIWVKNAMDHLEARILIYGEADSLKNKLIDLSLANNMRCRYTSYEEDSTYLDRGDDIYDEIGGEITFVSSTEENTSTQILSVHPLPVKSSSVLTVYVSSEHVNGPLYLKIYNMYGEVVHVVNLSGLPTGTTEVSLASFVNKNLIGYFIAALEDGKGKVATQNIVITDR